MDRSNRRTDRAESEIDDAPPDAEELDEVPGRPHRGQRVAAVLLAAGCSSRFGGANKLLAVLDGDPLVTHAVRTLRNAAVDPVVVVLGHEADRVRATLVGFDVETVVNSEYGAGQATSVAAGVAALPDETEYAVFALGDMPAVASSTVDRLVTVARESNAGIVVPTYEGRRGNPVVFHCRHFDALGDVDGDSGGRALFADNPVTRIAVDDAGVVRDVDTRSDLSHNGTDAEDDN